MYFFFLITKLHLVFLTLWGTGAEMLVWNPSVQVLKRQPELLGLLGILPVSIIIFASLRWSPSI